MIEYKENFVSKIRKLFEVLYIPILYEFLTKDNISTVKSIIYYDYLQAKEYLKNMK